MSQSDRLQLSDTEVAEVRAYLQRYLPGTAVWAYGSRVTGNAKPYSDLDLVAFAEPGQQACISELREAFEESSLPFRVDLFVWEQMPESFRGNIQACYRVMQSAVA